MDTEDGYGYYTSCVFFLPSFRLLSLVVGGPLSCGLLYFINLNLFENRLPIYIFDSNVDSTTFNSRLNDSVLFRYCSSYNLVFRSTKRKPSWLTQPHDSMTTSLFTFIFWILPIF